MGRDQNRIKLSPSWIQLSNKGRYINGCSNHGCEDDALGINRGENLMVAINVNQSVLQMSTQ